MKIRLAVLALLTCGGLMAVAMAQVRPEARPQPIHKRSSQPAPATATAPASPARMFSSPLLVEVKLPLSN